MHQKKKSAEERNLLKSSLLFKMPDKLIIFTDKGHRFTILSLFSISLECTFTSITWKPGKIWKYTDLRTLKKLVSLNGIKFI